jgi:hypothetical protein
LMYLFSRTLRFFWGDGPWDHGGTNMNQPSGTRWSPPVDSFQLVDVCG